MSDRSTSLSKHRRRWLGGASVAALGALLAVSGAGELVSAVRPDAVAGGEGLAVLHAHPVVRAWVGVQGALSVPLGLLLAVGALQFARGVAGGAARARVASGAFLGLMLCSQMLLALLLYPELLRMDPGEVPPSPVFWVVMLAAGPIGPAVVFLLVLKYMRP